jgi:hypothetical protein
MFINARHAMPCHINIMPSKEEEKKSHSYMSFSISSSIQQCNAIIPFIAHPQQTHHPTQPSDE